MKCNEAASLADRYINSQLDGDVSDRYREHIGNCSKCRMDLELARRLRSERNVPAEQAGFPGGARVKAPEGFTASVMSEIYRIAAEKPDRAKPRPGTSRTFRQAAWKPYYSRLGISLVLTGAIMAFSMLTPLTSAYPGAISGQVRSDVEYSSQSSVRNVLTGINSGITGVFRSINDSVSNIKGGTGNGM